jgi:hypothetical protein
VGLRLVVFAGLVAVLYGWLGLDVYAFEEVGIVFWFGVVVGILFSLAFAKVGPAFWAWLSERFGKG